MSTTFKFLGVLSRLALFVAAFKTIGFWVIPLVISSFIGRYLQIMDPSFDVKLKDLRKQRDALKEQWRNS